MYWKCVAKRKILSTKSRKMSQRNQKKKLLITDYAKVKKIKNKNGCNHTQTMTATLFRHLNEQGLFNDNNRDFKSCTLFVALFESFVERRPLLKHPCDGLVFFYLSSKRNWKFRLLVQTKPMGENTTTHTMKSIRSWY